MKRDERASVLPAIGEDAKLHRNIMDDPETQQPQDDEGREEEEEEGDQDEEKENNPPPMLPELMQVSVRRPHHVHHHHVVRTKAHFYSSIKSSASMGDLLRVPHTRSVSFSGYGSMDTSTTISATTEMQHWVSASFVSGSSPPDSEADFTQFQSPMRRRASSEHYVRTIVREDFGESDYGSGTNNGAYVDDEDDECEEYDENDPLHELRLSRHTGVEGSSVSSYGSSVYSSCATPRGSGSEPPERQSFEKLRNLQKLFQEGFITVTEYKDRRLQLVDERSVVDPTIARATDFLSTQLPIIYHEPPDFSSLRERDAIKHVFDSEERKWTTSRIKVKIDPQPFAKGGLRQVFHLQDLSIDNNQQEHLLREEEPPTSYVAKIAIDPNENPDTYFRDVEMQAVAANFARRYNSYNPPRRVEFLEAWILQLIPSGEDADHAEDITLRGTICGVEPFIAGEYHKHNNNFGYVSDLERNTPQAFSHFTYVASGQQILVVDIQGVRDHYTDPQIHTRKGKEFGKGNLATRGFERFLESHRCNPICRYLRLPLNNPKEDTMGRNGAVPVDPKGTIPRQPYMAQPRVRVDTMELCHYYGDSKAYKKYQAKKQQRQQSMDADISRLGESSHAFWASMSMQRNCSSWCGGNSCVIT